MTAMICSTLTGDNPACRAAKYRNACIDSNTRLVCITIQDAIILLLARGASAGILSVFYGQEKLRFAFIAFID